jgi:hypothetical protein
MIDNLLSKLFVSIGMSRIDDHTEGSEITCRKQVQQFLVIVAACVDIKPQELGGRTDRARAREMSDVVGHRRLHSTLGSIALLF